MHPRISERVGGWVGLSILNLFFLVWIIATLGNWTTLDASICQLLTLFFSCSSPKCAQTIWSLPPGGILCIFLNLYKIAVFWLIDNTDKTFWSMMISFVKVDMKHPEEMRGHIEKWRLPSWKMFISPEQFKLLFLNLEHLFFITASKNYILRKIVVEFT